MLKQVVATADRRRLDVGKIAAVSAAVAASWALVYLLARLCIAVI